MQLMMMAAFGTSNAIGLNAVLSKALGENNPEKVKKAIKTSLFLALASYIVIVSSRLLIVQPYFNSQTNYLEIIRQGTAYLNTVFGQTFSAFLALYFNYKYNKEIEVKFSLVPDWSTFIEILKTGIPTAFMQGFVSIVTMGVNMILIFFTTTAVAIYGVVSKVLNMILIMPHGMGLGVIPIVEYNYGAQKRNRVKEAIRFSVIFSVVAAIGMIVLSIIPSLILGMFNPTDEMKTIRITAIRLLSIILPLGGISIVLSSFFQGIGLDKYSMYL